MWVQSSFTAVEHLAVRTATTPSSDGEVRRLAPGIDGITAR
jgi:hypothetical protein